MIGNDKSHRDWFAVAKTEGKLETLPLVLELGWTVERIAQKLNFDIAVVKEAAQELASQVTTVE